MECLDPRFSPRTEGTWVIVTVSQLWVKMKEGDLWSYQRAEDGDASSLLKWGINVPGSSAWDGRLVSSSSYRITKKWDFGQKQTVYARQSFESIRSFLERDLSFTTIYSILQRLRYTCRLHGLDLNAVIHRRLQDEGTELIGCPSGKRIEGMSMRDIWSILQTKGGTEKITIN